ncbi:hypothetical protein SS1G_09374 [Sclerotinia sclerotiorum 1980 UF-70]|uniref:Uncharacterized protein n=1 Tax=Sclerotinia sclerotiorum (strain ATCC 18683 / 1980 / Ss-1) TaxID=665079 RepID=A7EVL5_SCLS1|nr:hypothetical protein SS1G_09374 [Sclerotinia sclerotiorum 1980 UF-70]EDN93507.1 hypothetical protein SS1G_09374 [Sclerotinia sclerotiorum 1980 UF-70]
MSPKIQIDPNLPADTVWFITGCSSGIGKALAQEIFTKTTHFLIPTARNPSSLTYLPQSPRILPLSLDVTSASSIRDALNASLATFKHIDILVNNAGYGILGDTENVPEESARKVFETNFWGAVNLSKEAVRIFREVNGEKGGLVVQISTVGGVVAFGGQAFYHARYYFFVILIFILTHSLTYSVIQKPQARKPPNNANSKFALEGFTESLSHEVPPSWNIRFLIIQPGGVRTNYGTSSLVKIPAHPAYSDTSFGTRKLEAFFDNPAFGDYMADVNVVAGIIVEAVMGERRGEVGLRVPVGPDSWSFIKGKYEEELVGLEEVRGLSWKTGNEKLLEVIGFLDEEKGM